MMKLADKLIQRKATHACPNCGKWVCCNLESGKPISTCWCNKVEVKIEVSGDSCLCEKCLKETVRDYE